MDFALLEEARERVPSIPVLINMCSKRVKQLNNGQRPYVHTRGGPHEDNIDIALKEIAEGVLIAEINFDGPSEEPNAEPEALTDIPTDLI